MSRHGRDARDTKALSRGILCRWSIGGRFLLRTRALVFVAFMIVASLRADDGKPSLPPAVARGVEFDRDVRPILTGSCVQCHGAGRSKGEFRIDTRATILK